MSRPFATLCAAVFLSILCTEAPASDYFKKNAYSMGRVNRSNLKRRTTLADRQRGSQNKLIGGITNLISAPFEIPAAMHRSYKRRGIGSAIFSGTVDGMSNFVKRAGSGLTDVATFPTKYPNKSYRNSVRPRGPFTVFRGKRKGR